MSKVSQEVLPKIQSDGTRTLTLYNDQLSKIGIAKGIKKLQISFPRQTAEFFNVLSERLIANGFTDKRFEDAVNNVIDNFQYKELNISDIVKFDKNVRLYTYEEATKELDKNGIPLECFPVFKKINGVNFRAYIGDLERLGIKIKEL